MSVIRYQECPDLFDHDPDGFGVVLKAPWMADTVKALRADPHSPEATEAVAGFFDERGLSEMAAALRAGLYALDRAVCDVANGFGRLAAAVAGKIGPGAKDVVAADMLFARGITSFRAWLPFALASAASAEGLGVPSLEFRFPKRE